MKILRKIQTKLFKFFYTYFTIICYLLYGRKKNYLLLCTPIHGNLGDQAIVLSEKSYLKKHHIPFFEITADILDKYILFIKKYSSPKQNILIHGGGFLGSIWPVEEYRFRNILKIFSTKNIVVLPQTITFDLSNANGKEFFFESYEIYKQHKNLIFFLRDYNSVFFIKKNMPELNYNLVPDIVLTYNYIPHSINRNADILFLKRKDIENTIDNNYLGDISSVIKKNTVNSKIIISDTVLERLIFPFQRKKEIIRKLNEISSYKFVVTDRLHGMIFAYITKTPCIVFNNQNSKVKAVYNWIKHCNYIKFCENIRNLPIIINEINNIKIKELDSFDKDFESLIKLLKDNN